MIHLFQVSSNRLRCDSASPSTNKKPILWNFLIQLDSSIQTPPPHRCWSPIPRVITTKTQQHINNDILTSPSKMVYTSLSAISALVFLALGALSSIEAAAIPAPPQSSLSSITAPTAVPPPTTGTVSRRFNLLKVAKDAGKDVKSVGKDVKNVAQGASDIESGVQVVEGLFGRSSGNSTRRAIDSNNSGLNVHQRSLWGTAAKEGGKGFKEFEKIHKAHKKEKKLKKVKEAAEDLNQSSGNSTRRDV